MAQPVSFCRQKRQNWALDFFRGINFMQNKKNYLLLFLFLIIPSTAWANFIWPPAMMYAGIKTWWAIPITFSIEYFFYRHAFKLDPQKSLRVTIFANLASAAIGYVTVAPFFSNGVAWMFAFRGTQRLVIIVMAPILLALINAVIEGAVARYSYAVPINPRRFFSLAGINFLTTLCTIVANFTDFLIR
jgi:hypothetical protein